MFVIFSFIFELVYLFLFILTCSRILQHGDTVHHIKGHITDLEEG